MQDLFIITVVRKNGIVRSKYLVWAKTEEDAQTNFKALAKEEMRLGEPIFFQEVQDTIQSEPVELVNGILEL